MRTHRHSVILAAGLALVAPAAVAGQADSRLTDVTALTCSFSTITSGDWGDEGTSASVEDSTLTFEIVEIDTDGATAGILGRFGESHIIARLSGGYLHFMQLFNAGPLYTTTVFDQDAPDGGFLAVHTRHEYTPVQLASFTSRPEQYYGACETGAP